MKDACAEDAAADRAPAQLPLTDWTGWEKTGAYAFHPKKAFSSPSSRKLCNHSSTTTPGRGTPRTLDAKPAQRRGSENSLSLFTSACFHVPPVALHFEPVSNGGPRTDFPTEECVLLLIHRTARSFRPPVREVRTGGRGVPGRRLCMSARVRVRWGGFSVLQACCASLETTKANVTLKEAE